MDRLEQSQIVELQQLADELNIRDPRKLYQAAARREYRDVSLQQAKRALRGDVARQLRCLLLHQGAQVSLQQASLTRCYN